MGKLSSFFRGRWRVGWLALIVGIATVLIVDAALARPRKRGDDNSWDYSGRDGSRGNSDAGGRNGSDSGASGRATNSSGGDSKDNSDKATDKNDKADRKGKDDDDDGRSTPQRDGGKAASKGSGAGRGDDPDPPKTVVEMFQRMFNAPPNTPSSNDGKSANRADDDRQAGSKPGDGDKGFKSIGAASKGAPPASPRTAAMESPAKRAAQRSSSPALGWVRDTRATDLFRRDEILIVNASRPAMAQLNFAHVETINAGSSSISRFVVPDGLDAISARQLLREQMPSLASAFNYVYRPYVPATEGAGAGYAPALGQPIRPSSNGCAA